MANILLIARGSLGDTFPFFRIGTVLKARGHAIKIIANCYYEDRARQSGFDFVALDTPEEFEQAVADGHLTSHPPGFLAFLQRYLLPKVLDEYAIIRAHATPGDTVLVTRNHLGIAAQLAAEQLGLPVVGLFAAPINLWVLPVIEELFRDILAAEINHIRHQIGLPSVSDWHTYLWYYIRTIAEWPDWFAPIDPGWPPDIRMAGFLSMDQAAPSSLPPDVQALLDDNDPPILISGGSTPFIGSSFYAVVAEACGLLGIRTLLVTAHADLLPTKLPPNVTWVKSLPFASVMHRMRAIIHHGGSGTIGRALAAGIPQLVLPSGYDRVNNTAYLQRLGVADSLIPSRWHPDQIAEALQKLLSNPEVAARCRTLASYMAISDPERVACDVIEEVLALKHFPSPPQTPAPNEEFHPPRQGQPPLALTDAIHTQLQQLTPERRLLLARRLQEKRNNIS